MIFCPFRSFLFPNLSARHYPKIQRVGLFNSCELLTPLDIPKLPDFTLAEIATGFYLP